MSKTVQIVLTGALLTFIIDFFLFLGIQLHYINYHEIDLYYNILFADNQNIYLWLFFTPLLGYVTLYLHNKIALIVVGSLFFLSLLTLVPDIGKSVGETIFLQKDKILSTKKFSYRGDLLYSGRKNIYFYDYKLNKTLVFDKNRIKELE